MPATDTNFCCKHFPSKIFNTLTKSQPINIYSYSHDTSNITGQFGEHNAMANIWTGKISTIVVSCCSGYSLASLFYATDVLQVKL